MDNTQAQLKKRLSELAERAAARSCYTYSSFLTADEQSTALTLKGIYDMRLEGGFELAERKTAVFGSESSCGYTENPPIDCIKISPVNERFSDELTHRDFLGALMNLGIKREMLGDIVLQGNTAYLFCLETVSPFVIENLEKVRHTSVIAVREDEIPEITAELPEVTTLTAASPRADAVVAAVYNLSRGISTELFEQGRIFINGREMSSASHPLSPGDTVSVRGKGRFIFVGLSGRTTKKGREYIQVRIFGGA